MTHAATLGGRLLRLAAAVGMALSWLLAAGPPAGAAVTGTAVEQPEAGASLDRAQQLVVRVDRTAPSPEEQIGVQTRLLYAGNEPPPVEDPEAPEEGEPAPEAKPVSEKVLDLEFIEQRPRPSGDRLRFGGVIDPHNLAWLPRGGVARNGAYILEYRAVGGFGDPDRPWQRFEFRIDAAPAATSMPAVGTADAAAKRMVVAWQASPTPDLEHYTVERRFEGGRWTVARAEIAADTTQIRDTVSRYGTYQYRVVAARPAGDGSKKLRTTTSLPSTAYELTPASQPAPRGREGTTGAGGDTAPGGDDGGSSSAVPDVSAPGPGTAATLETGTEPVDDPAVAAPEGFDGTYRGPLDFGVEPGEVTERVPVDIARGGDDDSTLRVLARSIDQERVLPPLAGGLILVVSAAHVVRYLNE